MNPKQAALTRAEGCLAWQIPAALAEDAVRDLIVEFRSRPNFVRFYLAAATADAEQLRKAYDEARAVLDRLRLLAERREKGLSGASERGTSRSIPRVVEAAGAFYAVEEQWQRMIGERQTAARVGRQLLALAADAPTIAIRWNESAENRREILRDWVERIVVEISGNRRGAARRLRLYPALLETEPLIDELK